MKTQIVTLSVLLSLLISFNIYAQKKSRRNAIFKVNSPEWIQTGGPGGGYINDIAIDPSNPSILYATGPSEGIYKSINGGNLWNLIKFPQLWGAQDIEIDPNNTSVLYCNYDNLSKSTDAGLTWQNCTNGFGNLAQNQVSSVDPINSDILYMAGRKFDGSGVVVFKTENSGQSWQNITGNLITPNGSGASALAVQGEGKIFVGINDWELLNWHKGKVFYSEDDGQNWSEVDFGQTEDRFISSIFANPFVEDEIWITEAHLYGADISQPSVYRSIDGGDQWSPIIIPSGGEAQVGAASSDGKVYITAGDYELKITNDGGITFTSITLPRDEMVAILYKNITIHPYNSDIIYLPLRAGGIAYTNDGGINWHLKNNGILNTNINLLAADPLHPSVIYAVSGYEGVFRSDDYGENWNFLNSGGMVHSCGDELTVDPINPNTVWYIAHVPYIHKSTDRGNTWEVLDNPYTAGDFNLNSIYSIALSSDNNIMYATDNGTGVFKGIRNGDRWDWSFLNLSEIDYTYTLAIHPTNPDIVYSGYNPKPFQDWAMVRQTTDGGNSWRTVLDVPKSTGFVSVVIDPTNYNTVYAGSTGERGEIYKSTNGGDSWSKLNEHFTMCTVWGQPQLIIHPDNSSIAYTATWLGGTWKTEDAGATWTLLENAPISSTALSLNTLNTNVIYLSDRTTPTVWKSMDAGKTWEKVADFSSDGALLVMRVLADGNTVYASTFHPCLRGARLYKSMNSGSNWNDITGTLPKGFLDIAVDPINPDIVYVTTNINGTHKSTDGGTSWTQLVSFPDVGAYDIEVDPLDPTILYTSARGGSLPAWFTEIAGDRPDGIVFDDPAGVYKSTDAGSTWTQILTTSASCRAIRQHPDDRNMLFAVDLVDGLQVSTDGGDSWTSCNTGLDTEVLTSCAVGGDKIYVGTQGCGVYSGDINMSTGAITWQPNRSNKPVPEVYSLQIEVDPTNSNRIFVGSNPGGLYRSDDGGVTFHDKNGITPSVVVNDPRRQGYYTFAINPSNTEEMWLGTWGKGIFKSYNAMNLDIPSNGTDMKMYGKHIFQIVIDPNHPNTVYVGTEEGVYKSSDGGENWIAINGGLTSTDVRVLHINSSGELYAGTRGYGLFKWENGHWHAQNPFGNYGMNWDMWDRILYPYVSHLIHPKDNSRMLIGTFPHGIYKSIDGGASWKESNIGWTNDGVFCLVCHPEDPEIVYSGTYNGVNRSLDFGEHWERWDNGWPPEHWVFSIDFDPTNSDIMYACSKNGKNKGGGVEGFHGTVMRSTNGGANWFEITNGLDIDQEFYRILVDRFDSNIIYLASQKEGMFISHDAGENWITWNEGLINKKPGSNGNNVTIPLVLSADHSILYFGSAGSGVFRRMITPILPVNNLCAEVKNHQIILKWQFDDLNNNFNHYNIYRSNTYFSTIEGLSPYASISNVSDTTYSDSNVELCIQYYYTVTTVDVNSYENDHIYMLGPVVDFGMSVTTTTLDTGYVGINYVDTLEAQGGQPPYSWELTQGSLPPGLSLIDSSGSISGMPTISGSHIFTVKVSDSHSEHYYANKQLTLVIIEPSSVNLDNTMIPDKTMLHQNYANPFNAQTTIRYQLRETGHVTIRIYNTVGQRTRTLVEQEKPVGYYSILWDGRNDEGRFLASGIYFYEMKVGDFWERRKLLLLK